MATNPKLSAIVHTKNSAETLERTLSSLRFVDELVIVDMRSSDDTLKIAKKFTKNIFQHEDVGYADPARNFGLSKTTGDWILVVDADEVVTDELQAILRSTMTQEDAADVYWLPRKNLVFSNWIQHTGWWPDYHPHFFRKGMVSWQVGVHRLPDTQGTQMKFPPEEKFALVHYNYTDITHFLTKLNSYTSLQAKERLADLPQDQFSATKLLDVFAGEFAKRALAMDGAEDGLHGVSLSLLQAMYEAVIYLKQWGEKGFEATPVANLGPALKRLEHTWKYWWADYMVRHTGGVRQLYWRVRRKWVI